MRRECRERYPLPPISKKTVFLAIPACITARAWRTCRDACRDRLHAVTGKTFPAFPAHAHPQFYASGKRPIAMTSHQRPGASNHHGLDCLVNSLLMLTSKKIPYPHVTGFFVRGIHRWPVDSPHKGTVTWKGFPMHDVIMLWFVDIHNTPKEIWTDSKVHGANMGCNWVMSALDGPHVGPMNLVSREVERSDNGRNNTASQEYWLTVSSRGHLLFQVCWLREWHQQDWLDNPLTRPRFVQPMSSSGISTLPIGTGW